MSTISILSIETILFLFYFGIVKAQYPQNEEVTNRNQNVATNINQNTNINKNTNADWPDWIQKSYPASDVRRNRNEDNRSSFYEPEFFRDDEEEDVTDAIKRPKSTAELVRESIRRRFTLTLKKVLEELLALIEENVENAAAGSKFMEHDIMMPDMIDSLVEKNPPTVLYDPWSDGPDLINRGNQNFREPRNVFPKGSFLVHDGVLKEKKKHPTGYYSYFPGESFHTG